MDAMVWLNSRQAEITSKLIELADQNSGSENFSGLMRVADWLEDWMDFRDTEFRRIPLPARTVIGNDGREVVIEAAPALQWNHRPDKKRRVLLAIHYDTVFGAQSPFQTCRMLSQDRLMGPGVADAKGGIMVIRYALKALQEFSLANDIGWTVLLNPDEELGSPSSHAYLQSIAPEFEFGLLFEPALPGGELVSERKGSGNFTLVVTGKSAHAGRHFTEGRNAVAALCRLCAQIDTLNGVFPDTTINIGSIVGGGPVNVVPDLAIGRINVRVADREAADWFERKLQELIEHVNEQDGIACRSIGSFTSPPKRMNDKMQQLMLAVERSAMEVLGSKIRWKPTGGVCDGNKLADAGLPNIDTLGPIGDGLHSHAEWVQLSSIVEKAQLIANLLIRYSDKRASW